MLDETKIVFLLIISSTGLGTRRHNDSFEILNWMLIWKFRNLKFCLNILLWPTQNNAYSALVRNKIRKLILQSKWLPFLWEANTTFSRKTYITKIYYHYHFPYYLISSKTTNLSELWNWCQWRFLLNSWSLSLIVIC